MLLKQNTLYFYGKEYQAAIGRGGIAHKQMEGDGITPLGIYPLRRLFYRSDKITLPYCSLQVVEIAPNLGWCDDVNSEEYNKLIEITPHIPRHELMYRDDDLYDIVIEIGYNDSPIINGLGSAIFIHIAKPDYSPTEGCIALNMADMLEIIPKIDENCEIEIAAA